MSSSFHLRSVTPVRLLAIITIILVVWLPECGHAQQSLRQKPPFGIPADAKLFNGKWYRVFSEKVSWHRAKEKCAAMRGQLAIVPDAATWEFIKSLSPASLWLGATDEAAEGRWLWLDGTPVTLSPWVTNNPNNIGGKEHYLAMVTHETKQGWNDFTKDGETQTLKVSGFICEWAVR